jgi:hypothetical protein
MLRAFTPFTFRHCFQRHSSLLKLKTSAMLRAFNDLYISAIISNGTAPLLKLKTSAMLRPFNEISISV